MTDNHGGGPSPNFITGDLDSKTRTQAVPSTEDRRRAALAVADHARDGQDCRRMLDMLGLDPSEGKYA